MKMEKTNQIIYTFITCYKTKKIEEDRRKQILLTKWEIFETLEKETRDSSVKSLDDNFSLIKDVNKKIGFCVREFYHDVLTLIRSYFAPEENVWC